MWESPEAQQKLVDIKAHLDRTRQYFRMVRARGTRGDRARAVGFGLEVLVGINETYEFDPAFRARVRTLAARWLSFDGNSGSLNRMFVSTSMMLDRFDLLVDATA